MSSSKLRTKQHQEKNNNNQNSNSNNNNKVTLSSVESSGEYTIIWMLFQECGWCLWLCQPHRLVFRFQVWALKLRPLHFCYSDECPEDRWVVFQPVLAAFELWNLKPQAMEWIIFLCIFNYHGLLFRKKRRKLFPLEFYKLRFIKS